MDLIFVAGFNFISSIKLSYVCRIINSLKEGWGNGTPSEWPNVQSSTLMMDPNTHT